MRLTLRTLLAYLDEILEPADAAEMGKKIQESEFATTLMHRTRDVTRRLRLGAPKLEGRGMGLDPNTVAEYLDNTLPGERVPDFEKVCLESDVHLAEVASAHQILALVLGEPAEFDARSRERMYALASVGEQPAPGPGPNGKASTSAADEQPARKKKRKKKKRPKVPEYLRDESEDGGKFRWLAVAIALLLLAGGGAWLLRAKAPETWRRLTGQVAARPEVDPNPPATNADETAGPDVDAADGKAGRSAAGETTDDADRREQASSAEETEKPKPPSEREAAEEGGAPQPDNSDDDAPIPPLPGERPSREPGMDSQPDAQGAASKRSPRRAAPRGEVIGRLISDHDVLLQWNADAGEWRRLPGRESIHAGDRLVALPPYKPSLALGAGVTVQLLGGASVDLDAPDADGAPGIRINEGRVLLMTVAKPDVFVRIQAGDRQGTAAFGRDDAELAIQVARELPDGVDPESQPAAVLVDLYVSRGEVTWVSPGAGPETMKAPSHRALNGDPRVARDAALPDWIESNDLSPIEKRAATAVDEHLTAERPVVQTLEELAVDKRWENSLLALRSLALIGDFDACVPVFNEDGPNQKNAWTPLIESLRAAMLRGPAVAARVRKAFQDQRGDENGKALFRMLWGYTPEQLKQGAGQQLVDYLSHPELDFRVLSFWNLHHVTGWTLSYRPEYSEAKRRRGAAAWGQKLANGQLAPAPGME